MKKDKDNKQEQQKVCYKCRTTSKHFAAVETRTGQIVWVCYDCYRKWRN